MGEQIRLAIYFRDNPRWTGGVYYLQNLLKALALREIPKEIDLRVITCEKKELEMLGSLHIPFPVEFIPAKQVYETHYLWEKAANRISRAIAGKNLFHRTDSVNTYHGTANWVYPSPEPSYFLGIPKHLCWLPDLQHKVLPEFFSAEELVNRDKSICDYIARKRPLVFSSVSSKNEFDHYFPSHQSKLHVLNFAVFHPDLSGQNIAELKMKYRLNSPFIFSPNQFWKHKNHHTVILAVEKMKRAGINDVLVLFSGNEHDYRFPGYAESLKEMVKEKNLQDNIRFLGFLPREEQLFLMKHALFILQPSLFEGWSTVVEDARALGKFVLASDLPVHREQLLEAGDFFNPGSVDDLVSKWRKYLKDEIPVRKEDYSVAQKKFGADFIKILSNLL